MEATLIQVQTLSKAETKAFAQTETKTQLETEAKAPAKTEAKSLAENIAKASTSCKGKLFTPVMREYIRKGFKQGQYFQMHPYVWTYKDDKDDQGFPVYVFDPKNGGKRSKLRLFVWYLNVLLTFAHSAYAAVRCYQVMQNELATSSQVICMQFVTVYFLWPSALQLVAIFDGPAFPVFFQRYTKFFEGMEADYFSDMSSEEVNTKIKMIRIGEALMKNMYRVFNGFVILMLISGYMRPDSPEYLTSLMTDPKSFNFLQMLPFMLSLCYQVVMFHTHCLVLFLMGIGFLFPILVYLEKITNSQESSTATGNSQNSQRLFRMYNAITILVINFNEIYSPLAIPVTKTCLIIFVVLCTYCGIRMEGLLCLSLGLVAIYSFFVLVVLFGLLSEFHTRSSNVLESMKSIGYFGGSEILVHAQERYLKKVVKSFHPIKVTVNSCYYVDKEMVVTMMDGVVQETVNFLLAN